MTWFDIMKLQPNRTRTVPGSWKASHKTDWLDKSVWSDFMDNIHSFINDKEDIAVAIKQGNTIRTKPDMTEFPIDALGKWFGGPNRARAYTELKREVKLQHNKGETLRLRSATSWRMMEDYMNKLVKKYLSTKDNTDEFTDYRINAQIFGLMASGIGPRRHSGNKAGKSSYSKFLSPTGSKFGKRPLGWMRKANVRWGLKQELDYALKLINDAPKNNPKKGSDFKNLVDHIGGKDYCQKAISLLVRRVFDFNRMKHPKFPTPAPFGGSVNTKDYYNDSKNLRPIKDLSKKAPVNPNDYLDLFGDTHPKSMPLNSPFYHEMWGGTNRPSFPRQAYYESHKQALKPFRARLLLIYIFHQTCIGNYTIDEFKEWVNY